MTTKFELSFNAWFDIVSQAVFEDAGERFTDKSWARKQFEYGRDALDVADEILDLYESSN